MTLDIPITVGWLQHKEDNYICTENQIGKY